MSKTHFDVIIAGAGPAGVAAALRLRQLNYSVAIVDDVKETNLKVGEAIPGATLRLLQRLGILNLNDLLQPNGYSSCLANASAWGSEEWTYSDAVRNPEGGGWHVLRNEFDASLRSIAKHRRTTFIPSKIKKVSKVKELNHVTLKNHNAEGYLSGKYLIDASGRASCILKQFDIERNSFEQQYSASAWFLKTENDRDKTTRIKSVANGWWYTASLPDTTRVVSFQGLAESVATYVKNPNSFLEDLNRSKILPHHLSLNDLYVGIKAKAANVSIAKQTIGEKWIAVGDAALSFDPLSSQGIFFALYIGIKGAEAIADAIQTPENLTKIIDGYENKIKSVFIENQRLRKLHYTMEQRYTKHPYWQQYFKNNHIR